MKTVISVFLLFACGCALAQDVVIVNARVYTGLNAEPLSADIRISHGKIVEIGKSLDTKGSVIEVANGAFVTAGFIDSRSTAGIEEVGLSTRTEDQKYEGESISASFDPSLTFHFKSSAFPALHEEGITHAVVTPEAGKNVLAGQATLTALMDSPDAVYADTKAVYVYLGEQGRELAGKSRAAALQQLIEALEDARLFNDNRRAYETNKLRDLSVSRTDLETLASVTRGEKYLGLYVDRASEIVAAFDALDRFELRIILFGAREAWKVVDEIKSRNIPVVINPFDNVPGNFDRMGARLDHPALLYAAGIEFAYMSENQFTRTRRISQGAGMSVSYGLPWIEALKAMTVNPARIWGVEDELGTLESGKDATLVVWDGDPFELSSHAMRVMIKGKWVESDNRQRMLRDRYRDIDNVSYQNR